jgi:hypothetical protein
MHALNHKSLIFYLRCFPTVLRIPVHQKSTMKHISGVKVLADGNGVPLPCDLFLDCFRVRLSKQIQQRTAEVVCMAVWVPQLIGNSIEEEVSP